MTNGNAAWQVWRVSSFDFGVVLSLGGFLVGFPPRLRPLPVRTPRPRSPTLNPEPLGPIFGPPDIVPYKRAMRSARPCAFVYIP